MRTTQARNLTASQEDYLETLLVLMGETGAARVRDIAKCMQVAKSSVTVALRSLAKRNMVHYEPYELVTLSEQGQVLAERIRRRHRTLSDFLTGVLDVDEKIAEANACRIEHAVGDLVMGRLSCFLRFMSQSSVRASLLPGAFREHCGNLRRSGQCRSCGGSADGGICEDASVTVEGDENGHDKGR